ncbi:hypothetical protein ACFO4O_07825 [Glaciecola siphonariae]|uniref:Sulfotransferase family protein n=1 Tax=Glaciecola siphonariae TaxID=521012 RepID=A0ABV9LWL9_9ALTE
MFYLVTGFHGSGTSLLAQTLNDNGINMGSELMGATFSNPLGHVEDMPVVRLHDKIYGINHTDWRYTGNNLLKPKWLSSYIETYLSTRNHEYDALNGVKDPRAVDFLHEWHQAAHGDIRFVFIYRHWQSATYSLFNRHSQHLLNSALELNKHRVNMSFWQQPRLAYDMWQSANQKILAFVQAHRNQCILLSQESFVSGLTIPQAALIRVKLTSEHFIKRQFRPALLSSTLAPRPANPSSTKPSAHEHLCDALKQGELDALYQALEAHSDLPSGIRATPAPRVEFTPESKPKREPKPKPKPMSKPVSAPVKLASAKLSYCIDDLTWKELSGTLVQISSTDQGYWHFEQVLKKPLAQDDVCFAKMPQVLMDIAKVAHQHGVLAVARVLKIRACMCDAIARSRSPFDMHQWTLFIEKTEGVGDGWLSEPLTHLRKQNPLSLRSKGELTASMRSALNHIHYNEQTQLIKHLQGIGDDLQLEASLSAVLLGKLSRPDIKRIDITQTDIAETAANKTNNSKDRTKSAQPGVKVLDCDAYLALSHLASSRGLFHLYEFSLFHALRAASQDNAQRDNIQGILNAYFDEYGILPSSINSVPNLLKSAQKSAEKNIPQTPSDKVESFAIKHRFAVLPHHLDYEKLLLIVSHYASKSEFKNDKGPDSPEPIDSSEPLESPESQNNLACIDTLERLNRKLCFLAKNNHTWLKKGIEGLSQIAANNLQRLLKRHWRKLWTIDIEAYLADDNLALAPNVSIFEQAQSSQVASSQVPSSQVMARLFIHSVDYEQLCVFSHLLNAALSRSSRSLDIVWVVNKQEYAQLCARCEEFNHIEPSSICFIEHISSSATDYNNHAENVGNNNEKTRDAFVLSKHVQLILSQQRYQNSQWNGFISCESVTTERHKRRQLMRWYSLLGFEFDIDALLNEFAETKSSMILAPYLPDDLDALQTKPLFYPDGRSFWLHHKAVEQLLNIHAPNEHLWKIKLIQALKTEGNKIAMMHNVLS